MTMIARVLFVALLCLAGTVSTSPYCDGALLAQSRGEPSMPPPGNPDHKEPPKGAWCDRSPAVEHHCECHAKCVEDEDGNTQIVEDGAHCRGWCFKKYCHCPADNCQAPTLGDPR